MGSELAKTLRSMSDDHRMVPDFSEELLDIADTIERQAKELAKRKEHIRDLQGRLWSVKETRNHLRTSLSEIQDTHQKTYDDLAATRAEVERLKARDEKQSDMIRTIDPLYQ